VGLPRDSNWIKLAYENQKPDSKLQTTPVASVYPKFDGIISNKYAGFSDFDSTLKIVHNDSLDSTISHMLLRFDLKEYAKYKSMGWTFENATLDLMLDSIQTPLYPDSANVGVFSSDRMMPMSKNDGYKSWREDLATNDSTIKTNGTTYLQGISGQTDTNGTAGNHWSWMVFDVKSEMKRMGFASLDEFTWHAGNQDDMGSVIVSVKWSGLLQNPSDSVWKVGGTGISTWQTTSGQKNKSGSITGNLDSLRWLWIGINGNGVDTTACGVWGDFKVYGLRNKDAQVLFYQVKDDGIDTNFISFKARANNLPWRHTAFENDYTSASPEGIGTEDLVQVFPNHKPLWNHYKGAYRSRSPVLSKTISGLLSGANDSTEIFLGLSSSTRLLPTEMENGCYPFRENMQADNAKQLIMNDTVYSVGIGGTANGSSNHPYLVYDLRSEAGRLSFGKLRAIRGLAGHNDSSSAVEVLIKTSTNLTQPTQTNWINNTGGVVERVHHVSSSGAYTSVNISTDGAGGSASNIKWVWLSVYSSSGNGSTNFGTFANLRVVVEPKFNSSLTISSSVLNQAVEKALADTTNSFVTLLGVLKDPNWMSFVSSRGAVMNYRPRLDLKFSDSKTLLSWEGRNSSLNLPAGQSMTLVGVPSTGDGRYDRVKRFHDNGQYAQISDSSHIDYSEGMMSFWYQMDMGTTGDAGAGAVFFKRDVSSSTQFMLRRDGSSLRLNFYHGDTTADSTGTNRMIWSCIDSFTLDSMPHYDTLVNPFDGKQHLFTVMWNFATGTAQLSIDGKTPVTKRNIAFKSNPASWSKANLKFGEKIDGYLENLVIRSKTFSPTGIIIARTAIDTIHGYLPYVQPGFNDTVDCIVISPDDKLFREECDKYAFRNMSMGIRTAVIPVGDVNKFYSGSDLQERIRNFLKQAYISWHPKYLVLAASTDYIPSRKVVFKNIDGNEVTSDRYYACLEGTWNEDGDEYFAEPEDSPDITTELIVGRFPASTWNELHSMIEKSTMGLGLPPYKEQCVIHRDTVMLTGMQMEKDKHGEISDGKYYSTMLEKIISDGAYTQDYCIRTYFPNDDSMNADSNTILWRLNKFTEKLNGFPGLWLHFGHGGFGNIALDRIGENGWVCLTNTKLKRDIVFNSFRRLGHVRIVGCESASQDLYSTARTFLGKPYGGALTYIGTSEFSYPIVESQILQEEMKCLADSSMFTWGDIFAKASDAVNLYGGNWNIARWVIMSRTFMGDPVLPVRAGNIAADDTVKIEFPGNIYIGRNTIHLTVKDKGSRPIEGALVGVTASKTKYNVSDLSTRMGKAFDDVTFAQCITNRNGEGILNFTLLERDTSTRVCITATHPDFVPSRKLLKRVDTVGTGISAYLYSMMETNGYDSTASNNGRLEAGEKGWLLYKVSSSQLLDTTVQIVFDPRMTVDSVSTRFQRELYRGTWDSVSYYLNINAKVLTCPSGVNNMKIRTCFYQSASVKDSLQLTVPVTGPDVVPVITYLVDDSGDVYPKAGDHVTMKILFGNRYSAGAYNVQASLIEYPTGVLNVINSQTGIIPIVQPSNSSSDDNIEYTVSGGYDEDLKGIICAKLRITADNIRPDTLLIDLNPMHQTNLEIYRSKTEIDYHNGVRIEWSPLKTDSAFGRRSDFLGYIVMRKIRNDNTDSYDLLTPWAVTSTNFFYDKLPDTNVNNYTYKVAVVDSSFNCSSDDTVDIQRPINVKKGFPIRAAALMKSPSVGNFDKDNLAEIYSIGDWEKGQVIGFRSNGQEAVVNGENDGHVSDTVAWQFVLADLNGDGFDDAVYVTDSFVVAHSLKNDSIMWRASIADNPHHGPVQCYRKPIIADVNNDGMFEIVVYTLDNSGMPLHTFGATTLDVFGSNGIRIGRYIFGDHSYAPAVVVGDFAQNHAGLEALTVSLQRDSTAWKYNLNLFSDLGSGIIRRDSVQLTDLGATGEIISSGIATGQIDNDTTTIEAVFCKGHATSGVFDSIMVFQINKTSGTFNTPRKASYPVKFNTWSIFSSTPSLGDMNNDGINDIVFATDDSIYVLSLVGDSLKPIVPTIPFGRVHSMRISQNQFTPQAILADIDADGKNEIVVNHQGDGCIWAFNIESAGGWHSSLVPGYPLKTEGRVSEACAISDLEGDDTLDLVAVDDDGFMYAWKLAKGSIYSQPWPSKEGNNWNTGNLDYKDGGNVGYLYEDWEVSRKLPFAWIESGANNARDTVTSGGVFFRDSGMLCTDASGDRNIHFNGPNMKNLKNYTIQGKMKFDNANAEFGINFYSQWPDSAKKYSLIRKNNGLVYLYYYSDPATALSLDTLDTASNDLMATAGQWYNFKVIVNNSAGETGIRAIIWNDTLQEPSSAGIDVSDRSAGRLNIGISGFVTHAGDGRKYWSPITVTANEIVPGAFMAYEDFKSDTVVDVAPYTPANLHPDYRFIKLDADRDTTGFVFYKNGSDTALIYKHKPGLEYLPNLPTVCRLIPQTNLEWRDYEFSGTIEKSSQSLYDSVETGVAFYMESDSEYYCLKVRGGWGGTDNKFVICRRNAHMGEDSVMDSIGAFSFSGDTDVVNFKVRVTTGSWWTGSSMVVDGQTSISVEVEAAQGNIKKRYIRPPDQTINRKKQGVCGVFVNNHYEQNGYPKILYGNGLKFKNLKVQKVYQ
jgi:hypothetical protein